jgi:hypothetical protein
MKPDQEKKEKMSLPNILPPDAAYRRSGLEATSFPWWKIPLNCNSDDLSNPDQGTKGKN